MRNRRRHAPSRPRTRRLPALLALAGVLAFVAGCNMVQGLGNDLAEASKATEEFIGGNPND